MTSIKLKKSSVAGKIPTDSDLAHGELAINFQDGKLFYKDASNNVKAFIDSAAVGSLITAGQGLDSAGVKSVHFADNESLTFGNDSDLEIFHNGNHSIIRDGGTGALELRGSSVKIRNVAGTKDGIIANQGGKVQLFYNNAKKLETIDSGVNVIGQLTADSATLTNLTMTGGSGAIDFTTNAVAEVLKLGNNSISQVHALYINDPGPNEGIIWSGGNTRIYESPNDLTTNSAGNLQVVHGGTRRLTVDTYGADVNGRLAADSATIPRIVIQESADGDFVMSNLGDGRVDFGYPTTFGPAIEMYNRNSGVQSGVYNY